LAHRQLLHSINPSPHPNNDNNTKTSLETQTLNPRAHITREKSFSFFSKE